MKKTTKERLDHRLAIAIGHLQKVREMIARDDYCIDVLQQSLAVQSALKKIDGLVLKNHLETCVADAMKHANDKRGMKYQTTAVREVVELFEKGRR